MKTPEKSQTRPTSDAPENLQANNNIKTGGYSAEEVSVGEKPAQYESESTIVSVTKTKKELASVAFNYFQGLTDFHSCKIQDNWSNVAYSVRKVPSGYSITGEDGWKAQIFKNGNWSGNLPEDFFKSIHFHQESVREGSSRSEERDHPIWSGSINFLSVGTSLKLVTNASIRRKQQQAEEKIKREEEKKLKKLGKTLDTM